MASVGFLPSNGTRAFDQNDDIEFGANDTLHDIYRFPKGSTSAEDYTGGRDLSDFINFIGEKTGKRAQECKVMNHRHMCVLTGNVFLPTRAEAKDKGSCNLCHGLE